MDAQNLNEFPDSSEVKFSCPSCGKISQEDVVFLCNKCKHADMIFQDGIYMCPSCLEPGENFQCMLCESKGVKMDLKS